MVGAGADIVTMQTVEEFVALTIAHPRLVAADAQLQQLLLGPRRSGLILLFGPTGVGKTTMLQRVERVMNADARRSDASTTAACYLRTPKSEGRQFDWRDLYRRGLVRLHEPAIEAKRAPPEPGEELRWARRQRASVADLRYAFEAALEHRRTRAWILDEAFHLITAASGNRLLQQLDVLKSLADATDTTIVLAGTYELLAMRHLSAQLSRRCREVHLARYRSDDVADVTAWRSVVATFEAALACGTPDLRGRAEELYESSFGCVGILKDWIIDALYRAAAEKQPLRMVHVRRTAMPRAALRVVAQRGLEGENLLGAAVDAPRLRMPQESSSNISQSRRPGERRPGRDVVRPA